MERPAWLPYLAPVEGPVSTVVQRLYRRFLDDFDRAPRYFGGLPVSFDRAVVPGEVYEQGFWHLVSRDDPRTRTRQFDPRRAERLPWCAALLDHASEPGVRVWDYREAHGILRTYVWLEQWDYVVVLENIDRRTVASFHVVTAYWVEGPATARRFRQKYDRRIK